MYQVLNIMAGCFGIVGGILWFLAASRTPIPPQGNYIGVVDSPTSPFARSWRKAAWFNQAAAVMTGSSALLFGLSAFCKL
jgi:hypothetical protein